MPPAPPRPHARGPGSCFALGPLRRFVSQSVLSRRDWAAGAAQSRNTLHPSRRGARRSDLLAAVRTLARGRLAPPGGGEDGPGGGRPAREVARNGLLSISRSETWPNRRGGGVCGTSSQAVESSNKRGACRRRRAGQSQWTCLLLPIMALQGLPSQSAGLPALGVKSGMRLNCRSKQRQLRFQPELRTCRGSSKSFVPVYVPTEVRPRLPASCNLCRCYRCIKVQQTLHRLLSNGPGISSLLKMPKSP